MSEKRDIKGLLFVNIFLFALVLVGIFQSRGEPFISTIVILGIIMNGVIIVYGNPKGDLKI